jgi:hypothetical protein
MTKKLKLTPEDAQKLKEHLSGISELSEQYGVNFIHNYKWREVLQGNDLEIILNTGIDTDNKTTGEDFQTSTYRNGELKSCKGKSSKSSSLLLKSSVGFEFDKQNDEAKVKQTSKYDCLLFSIFDGNTPEIVANILIHSKKGIADFNKLVLDKQEKFKTMLESCKKAGKRIPRDSIKFVYEDILEMPHCEFYIGSEEITLIQFKKMFH